MTEAIEVTVRDRTEKGWWVDQSHWYQQKLFSKTGVAEIVKLKDGTVTRGLLLYGYDGWFDCGYRPIEVIQWLKPMRWFESPDDMAGKEKEYAAYRYERLYGRPSVFRGDQRAQAQKGQA